MAKSLLTTKATRNELDEIKDKCRHVLSDVANLPTQHVQAQEIKTAIVVARSQHYALLTKVL